MLEKLRPVTIISDKSELENISKLILDTSNFEISKLTDFVEKELERKFTKVNENPYDDIYEKFVYIFNAIGKPPEPKTFKIKFPLILDEDEIRSFSEQIQNEMYSIKEKLVENDHRMYELKQQIELFENLKPLGIPIEEFKNFKVFKYKYGKIQKIYYERLKESLHVDMATIIPIDQDEDYIWAFVVFDKNINIDKVLSLGNFLEYKIPDIEGTPAQISWKLWDNYRALEYEADILKLELKKIFYENRRHIYRYFDIIYVVKNIYDLIINKYSFTENFFVLSGWVTQDAYDYINNEMKGLTYSLIVDSTPYAKPPTKMKNNKFFKHFEFIVTMYGIPSGDELDPTPFIAVLFLLFYGVMFGDVGHGLILTLFGFLMYKKKKQDLMFAIGCSGISSVIFGFLYGSVLGYEDILKPIWVRPMENINYFLIVSVIFGVIVISLAFILNIVNSLRRKEGIQLFFERNGFAGAGLYWVILGTVLYYLTNGKIPEISIGFIVILIILLYLKEVIFGHEEKIGMKLLLGFFELFETLLGFFTNTLSFVRLGAFALNHAGLFLAFYMMSKIAGGGIAGIIIMIIGNVLIIGLEGLIVFIQSLRLELYEFFSRFYKGEGRKFKPEQYKF